MTHDNNALAQELEACPLCHSRAEYRPNNLTGENTMAECVSCGCRAYYKKWNTRAQPAPASGDVGELVKRLRNTRLLSQRNQMALQNEAAAMLERLAGSGEIKDTLHPSHTIRSSDASTYDVICTQCNHTDQVPGGGGKLAEPCPKAQPTQQPGDQDQVDMRGVDLENAAWAWLEKKFGTPNDDPVDRAYDASEMVGAFHAGHALPTPPAQGEG